MKYTFVKAETMHISLNPEGDFSLIQGQVYKLPENNPHVRTLVAFKYLVPVEPATPVEKVSEKETKIIKPKKSTKS
ncbi:MAG: hypothetical protein D4R97_06450 [Bacteroidetes bacterium]|nr:MAG: hypothetical protein D4R97_06450 [Bacteroidota bacterium]